MINRSDPPRIVPKVWGTEEWILNGEKYACKRLTVQPGFHCSMHRHLVKDETFVCEGGFGWILVDCDPIEVSQGVIVEIPPGTWHQFWCPENEDDPLVLLEVSTRHDDADVERRSESGSLTKPMRCPAPGEAPTG